MARHRPRNAQPRAFSTEIFDLIIPEIQRCVSLRLYLDDPTLTRLLTLPPGSLCALRSISIRSPGSRDVRSPRTIPRIIAFQQCPRLRNASFEFVGPALDPAVLELPWHQLTHLRIYSSVHEYKMLGVLRRCASLQECDIFIHSGDVERILALPIRSIMLPSLHVLHLKLGDAGGHSAYFVDALHLPHLRSLRLSTTSDQPCRLLPLFWALFSETVRELDLSEWPATDLHTALAFVPNLEKLKFCNSNAAVLCALGYGVVVPRLLTLRLGAVKPDDLLEMRKAATRANSGISAFTDVSAIDSGDGDIDVTRHAELRKAGMRLVFRNLPL